MTTRVAKLADIKAHPEKHRHNFDALCACCLVDGAIDLSLMEAHEGLLGYNAGIACDVLTGPCACGAWHYEGEPREFNDT